MLDNGIELAPNTPEAVVRPISALPDDSDLKAAVWEFVEAIAPECGPTQPLVSRICRTIKNVLDDASNNASDGVSNDNDEDKSRTARGSYLVGSRKTRLI